MKPQAETLLQAALRVRENAYAPYSHFCVGAALLGADGVVYTGCNVENVSFGATNCAERTALFYAVSQGCRTFQALAVVGGPAGPIQAVCSPCGICRQVLAEFCGPDFPVYLWDGSGAPQCVPLSRLLPATFSAAALGEIPKSEWITNKNTD